MEKRKYNGKPVNKQSLGIDANAFVAVTACRFVEYKGIFSFLRAASLSKTNCVFVLAGEGELKKQIKSFILENNLAQKVKLAGYVADMEALYSICDVVVLCSTMEAQPYLLLEAMRARKPVVATDVTGNRELLLSGRGLLVRQDPVEIASAIDEILIDKDKKRLITQNAYKYFSEFHNLENQVLKLSSIYKAALLRKERNKIS